MIENRRKIAPSECDFKKLVMFFCIHQLLRVYPSMLQENLSWFGIWWFLKDYVLLIILYYINIIIMRC